VDVYPSVRGPVLKVCFKAGAEVKGGDLLFELDPRAAQLALGKAQSELVLAEAKRKGIGPSALDLIAEAEARIRAAKLELDRARLELEATRVAAPMSGQVGRPLVDEGALVFRGSDRATLLTTITSLDPIGLTFDMDQNSFLRYQRLLRENQVKGAGSPLRMRVADESGYPHEGTLESFENRVNPETGTVRVRGSFPNPGRLLLPGMFASVRLTFGKPRAVLEVPEEALLSDQGKRYVLVVGEGNRAQRRDVTPGWADDGMRVIEKGLSADDWVVITLPAGLRAGDRVEPLKKAAPEGSDPGRDRDR
jgi:RND family efflux transporter MFP subunit